MKNESRQALVELLFVALYQDNHLSLLEDCAMQRALTALGSEDGSLNELDIDTAIATAREAGSCEIKTEGFLQSRTKLLRSEGHSIIAFEWLRKVLAADGVSEPKNQFLRRVKGLLFPTA